MELPPPQGLALLLCDNLYVDRRGKRALVGLFNRITAPEFPATHARMVVFVSVTDLRPNSVLKLDISDAETDEPLFQAEGPPPEEAGPIAILDLVFDIENLTLPREGIYWVRFWGNNRPVIERPIEVVKRERHAADEENEHAL
jgi:hypothetical protein